MRLRDSVEIRIAVDLLFKLTLTLTVTLQLASRPIRIFLFAYLFIHHFIIDFIFQSCFSNLRGCVQKIECEKSIIRLINDEVKSIDIYCKK